MARKDILNMESIRAGMLNGHSAGRTSRTGSVGLVAAVALVG